MIAHLTSCIEEGLSCICFERPGVKATRLGSAEMQRCGPALYVGIHRKEVCALQQLFHAQVEPPPSTATVRCQDLRIGRGGPRGRRRDYRAAREEEGAETSESFPKNISFAAFDSLGHR